MFTSRRKAILVSALALAALAIPSSAFGQATRTWVSGVGDDANPCSRTAPCKTFAGAISKTAVKGEINVLDPGGFGALTINKGITVKSEGVTAGVLTNAGNAITVNAPSTDKVNLVGLDMNGLGTALNGINIINAKKVTVKDMDIYQFARNGILVAPNNVGIQVEIKRVHVHDVVGNGVFVAPTAAGNDARATVRNSELDDNGCGATSTTFGQDTAFVFTTNCGAATNATGINSKNQLNLVKNSIADNGTGVFSRGGQATVRIGENDITGNFNGLSLLDGGVIRSFGNNNIDGNTNTSPPTATPGTSKRVG
jgi:hypothetical protein